MVKLLYSSYANYLDDDNPAALAIRSLLHAGARRGWKVRAICGSAFPFSRVDARVLRLKAAHIDPNYRVKSSIARFRGRKEPSKIRSLQFNDHGVETKIFLNDDTFQIAERSSLPNAVCEDFLAFVLGSMRQFYPDFYATSGVFWDAFVAAKLARVCGIKSAYFAQDVPEKKSELLERFDVVFTPSLCAQDLMFKRTGIKAVALPPVFDETELIANARTPHYATFISPRPEKGLALFAAVARALNAVRPDIPLLVVGGRTPTSHIIAHESLRDLPNVRYRQSYPTARDLYAEARVLLCPAASDGELGLEALEASFNGVPVLCSDRGALPETIGRDETLRSLILPSSDDFSNDGAVESYVLSSWVDAIVNLWDDEERAREVGKRLQLNARRFSAMQSGHSALEIMLRAFDKAPVRKLDGAEE